MGSVSGDVWVLFNGEIYNHRDLRRELIEHGFVFRTNSDTEALLAAYLHWGDRCFERLNGMWGAVIIDTRRRTITLSRDRFGIRPLCHRLEGQRLLVGSEAKQIASLGSGRPAANPDAVLGFLAGRRLPCEQTHFAGVHALPLRPRRSCRSTEPRRTASTPAAIGRSTGRPRAMPSVRCRSRRRPRASKNCCTTRLPFRRLRRCPSARCCQAGSIPRSCRASWSRRDAARVSTRRWCRSPQMTRSVRSTSVRTCARWPRPSRATMSRRSNRRWMPSWVAASMDRVTWHQEEPLPGVALVAPDHAYHAAAAHGIRVVLEGTGSDEIFAGYRHQLARIRDHVRRRQWGGAARELTGAWRRDNVVSAHGFVTSSVSPYGGAWAWRRGHDLDGWGRTSRRRPRPVLHRPLHGTCRCWRRCRWPT